MQYLTKDVADSGPILLRVAANADHKGGGFGVSRFNWLQQVMNFDVYR